MIDQSAPTDPLEGFAVDRFERARDPAHARLLPDGDLRQLFEANRLALLRRRSQHAGHETEGSREPLAQEPHLRPGRHGGRR